MAEIKYPEKRTFWRATNGTIVHEGFTDSDQVTTTGQSTLVSNISATTLYPELPKSGEVKAGAIYSYNGGMVVVVQTHNITIYKPEEAPALFNVFRANTEGVAWIENEKIIGGDKRTHIGKTWICIQSHTTLKGWEPDKTPSLWKEAPSEEIPVFKQPTGAHDVYMKGARVHFPTITDPVYESLIDNNSWSPITYPAGWKKI